MNREYYPKKILIESGCEELAYTRSILSRIPDIPVEKVSSIKNLPVLSPQNSSCLNEGKRILLLMKNRGRFFKPCPGTRKHVCCLYKVLHHAAGCPLDCSYCILQVYLNNPYIVFYVNIDDMLRELEDVFKKIRGRILRLGTGEYTDSLALEEITQSNQLLLPLLKKYPDVFLEVKTKTADISTLLGKEPKGQIIFAWSLNPKVLIEKEELGAAGLKERLNAAKIAQVAGHPVAFHFDPLLRFEGWEGAYQEVARRLGEAVDLSRAFWVSLGSFRFPPLLKTIVLERFPQNTLLFEEFIIGEDGKMRYFKPLRTEMYKKMVKWLKKAAPDVFIYLCMEREDVWDRVFGFHPESNLELKRMLDERCEAGRKRS